MKYLIIFQIFLISLSSAGTMFAKFGIITHWLIVEQLSVKFKLISFDFCSLFVTL